MKDEERGFGPCVHLAKRDPVTTKKEQSVTAITGGSGGAKVQGLILVFYY
jgi:hypothetical protein